MKHPYTTENVVLIPLSLMKKIIKDLPEFLGVYLASVSNGGSTYTLGGYLQSAPYSVVYSKNSKGVWQRIKDGEDYVPLTH